MLTLIGMGPGNPKLLTYEAQEAIEEADELIAFGRLAETVKQFNKPLTKVSRIGEIPNAIESGKKTALLASGDVCFYGILDFIRKVGVKVDRVVPGISSLQYMMSRLQKSWHHAGLTSLHGRPDELNKIAENQFSVILTDRRHNPDYISKRLKELGISGTLYVGFELSYDTEEIVTAEIGDSIGNPSRISIVVVERATPS